MADGADRDGSWIDRLGFDPVAHPDARVLTGYAKHPDANTLRLYLTLQLNEYVEFAVADVLAEKTFGSGKRGPALTVAWVKGGTVVRNVRTIKLSPPTNLESEAAFLRGSIIDRYSPSAATDAMSTPIVWKPPTGTSEVISVCIKC